MPRARARSRANGVRRTDLPITTWVVPGGSASIWRSLTMPDSMRAG
jgi:hypothetical protein